MEQSSQKLDPDLGVKVVCIQSANLQDKSIGTGFVIFQDHEFTYILTCAHVIRDVGGKDNVMVGTQCATVIAISGEDDANDLAVIRLKRIKTYPLKPLASYNPVLNSKNLDLSFKSIGYFILQGNQKLTEKIYGQLRNLSDIEERQAEPTKIWKLSIDSGYNLKSGYSGAPVLNPVHRVILGVISHKERSDGKRGLAISIEILAKVWNKIPEQLIRNNIYNLDEISKFLFLQYGNDASGFRNFCQENFSDFYMKELGSSCLLVKIAYLVLSCHQHNLVESLLESIEKLEPQKFKATKNKFYINKRYFSGLTQNLRHHHFEKKSLCRFLSRFKSHKIDLNSTAEIIYQFSGRLGLHQEDLDQLESLLIEAFVSATAVTLSVSRSEIKVLAVNPGSIKIQISLPSTKLDELIYLFETDRSLMQNLGIQEVFEFFDQPFHLDRIKMLIAQNFNYQTLLTIASERLDHIPEEILIIEDKNTFIDQLLNYLSTESRRVSQLLTILENLEPNAYRKHSPYIKVPRRPGQVQSSSSLNNSRVRRRTLGRMKILRVGLKAAAITFLYASGIWLLYFLALEFNPVFSVLALIFLPYLGNYIGEFVAKELNYRGGKSIARLSILSFLSGALSSLFVLLTFVSFLIVFRNIFVALLWTLIVIPLVLIVGMIILAWLIIQDPNILINVLASGSFLAIGGKFAL